jgi:hypothetical protein
MKETNKSKACTIITPNNVIRMDDATNRIFEAFITRLIESKEWSINISINISSKNIEREDINLKKYLHIVLKSGKFRDFYTRFNQLLHKNSICKSLVLLISTATYKRKYGVTETNNLSSLNLNFKRC